jgi:hypothetical protein
MAALLTAIVLVFTVCHSLKAAINIYEAKQVGSSCSSSISVRVKHGGSSLPSSKSPRPNR